MESHLSTSVAGVVRVGGVFKHLFGSPFILLLCASRRNQPLVDTCNLPVDKTGLESPIGDITPPIGGNCPIGQSPNGGVPDQLPNGKTGTIGSTI